MVFWSSGFIGAELGTRHAAADTLLAWRYVVAAALLVLLAAARGARYAPRDLLRHGTLGVLCQCLFLGGVVTGVGLGVPAGSAALVAATQPLLVAAVSGPLLGEPTTARQRCGMVLGLGGVALVVATDVAATTAPGWAYLLPLAGMLGLTAGTLLERRWRPAGSALDSLTLQTVAAAGVFVAVAGATGRLAAPTEPGFWWAVAWVVVLSSFGGYGAYLVVLRRAGAVRASTLLQLTPPTTGLWALAMFGDVPGPLALPGAVACAVGVLLTVTGGRDHRAVGLGPTVVGSK